MSKESSADEQPKRAIADAVVTRKRQYFEPHRDYVAEEVRRRTKARKSTNKQVKQEEEGDG